MKGSPPWLLLATAALGTLWLFSAPAAQAGAPDEPACLARETVSEAQAACAAPERNSGVFISLAAFESELPVVDPDPSYSYFPFSYLRAKSGGASFYGSAEAAKRNNGAPDRINPGFVFLSYPNNGSAEDSAAYQTQRGFVRKEDVSPVTPSYFHGLAFSRTPDRPFGWVISGGSCPQRTPGGVGDYADYCFTRYEVVQIFGEQVVDGERWYLIGPDKWLQADFIARVDPDPRRPQGVEGDKWVSVNLAEQTVTAYEDGRLVYATVASTGKYGTWTKPGTFQVWARLERDNMTGGAEDSFYYLEDVPWVLYFDQARALHGTYWHNKFGVPTSRGCVNLTIADARWFFEFAPEGTEVFVWDPTGETPTDPALYGAGGA